LDTASNKILFLKDKKEVHSFSTDSLTAGIMDISASPLNDGVKLLISTDKYLTIAKLINTGREFILSTGDSNTFEFSFPRYQSFVYRVTGSENLQRDVSDWIMVIDTTAVDDVPSQELYTYAVRSRILLFSEDGSTVTYKPIYSSPLFLRFPFAVRFRSRMILGFLEGAYGHYILKFRSLRL